MCTAGNINTQGITLAIALNAIFVYRFKPNLLTVLVSTYMAASDAAAPVTFVRHPH